jgi:hypothetical protein
LDGIDPVQPRNTALQPFQEALAAARRQSPQLANVRLELLLAVAATPGKSAHAYAETTGIPRIEAFMCLEELRYLSLVGTVEEARSAGYVITPAGEGLVQRLVALPN